MLKWRLGLIIRYKIRGLQVDTSQTSMSVAPIYIVAIDALNCSQVFVFLLILPSSFCLGAVHLS